MGERSGDLPIVRTAIAEYVRRAAVIGITWPIPEELDDTALEAQAICTTIEAASGLGHVHAELRRL